MTVGRTQPPVPFDKRKQYPMTHLLEHVADLCREAHDAILEHGWKQVEATLVDDIDSGMCLGSALAYADNQAQVNGYLDFYKYAGLDDDDHDQLCAAGEVFHGYAADTYKASRSIAICGWEWNDAHERTVDDVIDLLLNVEKHIREDLASWTDWLALLAERLDTIPDWAFTMSQRSPAVWWVPSLDDPDDSMPCNLDVEDAGMLDMADDGLHVVGDPLAWAATCANSSADDWSGVEAELFGPLDVEADGYMFSKMWANVDNTPAGCARRIRTYLSDGVPADWGRHLKVVA